MRTRLTVLACVVALTWPVTGAAATTTADDDGPRHDTIDLPAGFEGEGVAVGAGTTFYAGSLADGRIARGDLRAGTSEVFVSNPLLAPAVGLKADLRHGLLWVAGGPTGQVAIYHLATGAPVEALTLTTADLVHQRRRRHRGRGLPHQQPFARDLPDTCFAAGEDRRAGDDRAARAGRTVRARVQHQRDRGDE